MSSLKIQQAYDLALRHRQAGRLQDAEQLCRQILTQHPDHADALHLLGVIAWQVGGHDAAVKLIRQAIALRPKYPEAHYNLGNALRDNGQLDEAIAAFRHAISLKPAFPGAFSNLGGVLADKGQFNEAVAAQLQAIALKPNFAEAHYNLGNAFRGKGQPDEAIAAFRQAIRLNPNFADAHFNLGIALGYRGKLDEAILAFRQAIAVKPNFPQAYSKLGAALLRQGQLEDATAAYRQAIALDPQQPSSYQALGRALEIQGKIDEAIAAFKAAHEREPTWAASSFDLAALGVGEVPPASPRELVTELFDDYSGYFDQHLVERLDYKGPQFLFDAVSCAAPRLPLDIIDLGCGTGLCGALFRPIARHLTGIDLSPQMIEKARLRGVYDLLRVDDLILPLQERPQSFDLILAADVFVYVGRLDEVFEAAAKALRPGGLFAFTIESTDTGDYVLCRSRRYAQSVAYIRRLALQHRFTEVSIAPAVLRHEIDNQVLAQVIVLRRLAT